MHVERSLSLIAFHMQAASPTNTSSYPRLVPLQRMGENNEDVTHSY